MAIEDVNRPTVDPIVHTNVTKTTKRYDYYRHEEDEVMDRHWDRYDSRGYSRNNDYRSSYKSYHDDRYRSSYHHHGSGPPPYTSSSSRYSPSESRPPPPRSLSRWNNRSPSISSHDSKYKSRSRSRSRDNYYNSSRWENESDWGRDRYNTSSSRRRTSEYWDERRDIKKPIRPSLVISKKCLPFVRGVLEDLKKLFYYYNFIDVSPCMSFYK